MKPTALALALALLLLLVACGAEEQPADPDSTASRGSPNAASSGATAEPEHVVVDHILVAVRGPRMGNARNDGDRARKLAYQLLEDLQAGADWDAMKKAHSEDPPPGGPYAMSNRGVSPRSGDEFQREGMAPAFGDVGFTLAVGEIGIADYDAAKSPFGYHIIKRIR